VRGVSHHSILKSQKPPFRSWFDILRYLRTGFTTNGNSTTYSRLKAFAVSPTRQSRYGDGARYRSLSWACRRGWTRLFTV